MGKAPGDGRSAIASKYERLIASVGVNDKLGGGRGDPSTRLRRRVEGFEAFGWQRVMAGSEAQLLDDEAYAAKLVTLFSLRWRF